VQLLLGNGSREALSAGDYTKVNASTWPVPGTVWQPLYLSPKRAYSALSLNDGSLAATAPLLPSVQLYLDVPSLATATDPQTTSTVAVTGAGPLTFNDLFDAVPLLAEMNAVTAVSLTYTTPPLSAPVDVAGPADLEVFFGTVMPFDDIYAVVGDVAPDGTANAVGVGRLRTAFPDIDQSRSLVDAQGQVVQPYGDYSAMTPVRPGTTCEYHVEFWPIGNHFAAGHRLRLYLVGTSAYMLPAIGLNLVSIGGGTASRLLLPVLPGSDIYKAMGAP
jgi:predicted acyl esterase